MKIIFDKPLETYEPKPTTITYGYDRSVRLWCIIVEDQKGYEIKSEYVATKDGCAICIEDFKKEYGIDKVIKLKAY